MVTLDQICLAGPSRVLIFGATGNIGRHITEAILGRSGSRHQTRIFLSLSSAEDESKSDLLDAWKNKGADIQAGDLTKEEDVSKAYEGADTVVSCLGRLALQHQINLIEWAAKSEHVRWFFPSEYGTDIEYGPQSKDERPHQMKLKVRDFVRKKMQTTDSLKVTYIVTGPYPEMFINPVKGVEIAGGFDVSKRKAFLISDSERVGFTAMPE